MVSETVKLSVVVLACNPSTQGAKAGGGHGIPAWLELQESFWLAWAIV